MDATRRIRSDEPRQDDDLAAPVAVSAGCGNAHRTDRPQGHPYRTDANHSLTPPSPHRHNLRRPRRDSGAGRVFGVIGPRTLVGAVREDSRVARCRTSFSDAP